MEYTRKVSGVQIRHIVLNRLNRTNGVCLSDVFKMDLLTEYAGCTLNLLFAL